jgi:hypothetical protein
MRPSAPPRRRYRLPAPYATRTPRRALYLWGLMYVDDPDRKRGRERLEEAAEISLEAGIAIVLGTDSGGDDRAELTP